MHVIVPFGCENPKSRLDGVLTLPERREFARAMFQDVIETVDATRHRPVVVASGTLETSVPARTRTDSRPLSTAVNAVIEEYSVPIAVVMADLPLATPEVLSDVFDTAGDVVLVPGLGGGTNVLVVRDDSFAVDFHGGSYWNHRDIAHENELEAVEAGSWRLAVDIDEPGDLVEVLGHSTSRASEWLVENGFSVDNTTGRVTVTRE